MKIFTNIFSILFLIQYVFGNTTTSNSENGIELCNGSNCKHDCPRDSIWAENDQCVCSIDKCNEGAAIACEFGYKSELVRKGTDKPGECCDLYQCTLIKGTEDCTNVTCSENVEDCPPDSYRLPALKSLDECCSIPQDCQCLPKQCEPADCAPGLMEKLVQRGTNQPGQCCPVYACVKPEVVTEEIALEPLPGGCITDEGKIINNGESWMEDPCTSCLCNNGDKACHAFMCQVSCEMPLYVPSECCPVCNTTSDSILAPECPPLTNCTTHCMQGFKQDAAGCITCQCKQEECKLECPNGYAEAGQGKKLCKCAEITRECASATNCPKNCTIKNDKATGCDICNCDVGVVCESLLNCEKECDEGYLTDDKGCNTCQCKTLEHNETIGDIPESFCTREDGSIRPNGESWIEGCLKCVCTNGTEKCTTIPCAPTDCPNPILNADNTCCPVCPETPVPLKSCKFPDGHIIEHNVKYKFKPCADCFCNDGQLACIEIECPYLNCTNLIQPKFDECCPTCSENQPNSVNTPRGRKCDADDDGLSWDDDDCNTCSCRFGNVTCVPKICDSLNCIGTVTLVPGTCCPVCDEEKICVFENSRYKPGDEWMANSCTQCKCTSGRTECTQKDCRQACRDSNNISTDKICCPSCPESMKGVKMMHEVFYLLLLAALICVSGILSMFVLKQCRIRKQQLRLRDYPCPVQKYHQYKYISTSPFETLNNSQKITSPEKASLVNV